MAGPGLAGAPAVVAGRHLLLLQSPRRRRLVSSVSALSNSRTGPRRVSSFMDQSVNRRRCIITRPITVISNATVDRRLVALRSTVYARFTVLHKRKFPVESCRHNEYFYSPQDGDKKNNTLEKENKYYEINLTKSLLIN